MLRVYKNLVCCDTTILVFVAVVVSVVADNVSVTAIDVGLEIEGFRKL